MTRRIPARFRYIGVADRRHPKRTEAKVMRVALGVNRVFAVIADHAHVLTAPLNLLNLLNLAREQPNQF